MKRAAPPAPTALDVYTQWRLGDSDTQQSILESDQKKVKGKTGEPWKPPALESDDFAYEDEDEAVDMLEKMNLAEAQVENPDVAELEDGLQEMDLDTNFLSAKYLIKGCVHDPSKFERPPLPPSAPAAPEFLTFQHMDTTYGVVDNRLEVRLWGTTAAGHSVLVRVRDFLPYFIVDVGSLQEAKQLRDRLENYLHTKNRKVERFVLGIEQVQGRNFCGYHMGMPTRPMYKFYMARPSFISAARDCFEYVNRAVCERKYDTYEGNVEYELRYMIDAKVNGCEWLVLGPQPPPPPAAVAGGGEGGGSGPQAPPPSAPVGGSGSGPQAPPPKAAALGGGGSVHSGPPPPQPAPAAPVVVAPHAQVSTVQYEFLISHKQNLIRAIPSAQKGDLAPMRILSYDIEVLRKARGFPKATEDPCIMIAAALQVTGVGIVSKAMFVLKSPIFADDGIAKSTGGYDAFKEESESAAVPTSVPPARSAGGTEAPPPPPPADPARSAGSAGGSDTAIYMFTREADMLMAFSQYIRACDPEAFTGWNISNFDLPYLAERAKQLHIFDEWMSFSRIKDKPTWIRRKVFQSKAHGAKTINEMICEGRFDHDGLTYVLRGVMEKYRSYKLNAIAKKVLDDQKVDVGYSQIPILFEGSDEDRTRLAYYCLIDALLPLRLLEKLMAIVNGIEQARVTGVPIRWLLEKGQGKKTQSNLLRYKEDTERVPSRTAKTNTEVTGGGYVKEPKRGFYQVPLASLDFASLYPSIMIAFNICFSTKVSLAWARANLKPEDYWIPPPAIDKKTDEQLREEQAQRDEEAAAGVTRKKKSKADREREAFEAQFAGQEPNFCFVKRHIKQGTLPRLLETLLETRRNVKAMMKNVNPKTDPIYYSVLDGRQLALKVVCNSVCK